MLGSSRLRHCGPSGGMVRWQSSVRGALCTWVLASGIACDEAPGSESGVGEDAFVCTPGDSEDLYQKRIAPLLSEGRDSSCNECHLSGVDLTMFVRDDPCATMGCMVERGLVDLEDPESSTVLSWIARADPASELVTQEVIDEEYQGMLEWISYTARCGAEVCEPIENPCGDAPTASACEVPVAGHDEPPRPWDDPGDCSDKTLESMFAAKVYEWRGRCFPCHFADQGLDAPHWIEVGDCEIGSLQTMRNVIDRGLVDTQNPTNSLLLRKPLGQVEHGGGAKFQDETEGTYVDFLAWLERYASCQ